MKFAHSTHRTTGRFLSGSVALLALLVTSCTSTGTGLDGKPLQMTSTTGGSMIADTLQSAADQTATAEATATATPSTEEKKTEAKPGQTKPVTVAEATNTNTKEQTKPVETATAAEQQPTEVAAVASPQPKSSSLFGMFGGNKSAEPEPAKAAEQPAAVAPTETAKKQQEPAKEEKTAESAEPQQTAAAKPAEAEKPVQVASLFGSTKSAYASPQRPTATQGSIARLFSDESAGTRSDRTENKKLAVAKPVSPSAKHDYNYSLPGVRPNGGVEIKHRNSLYDDSDIDANEDDEFANVTLASAPGLARLAPNGLKVQRQTVDVACLKPQLVSMLKSMERHFRRPVMVTSGYRSPSYNRKVNGARKSLHMICAAADIQIDGVSKWEVARFARSMSGRGGVGTYCHTTSVHVDVGPERDWNWRCKG
ncbi:D-Ala-D-Ala carboxypeptidase family metallohydrolase [Ochrobactrum vermis]|uniref:Murein endopeptidase K n=1 Tax=Ochrobactrum vermis TaxID=1827297 RepID=A0ABU8PBU3_9HYPH|nr:YcbK family protein [Ochrobactrum vermis]PQZ30117.1 shikimate transporter [Ochrobactrum vermis]